MSKKLSRILISVGICLILGSISGGLTANGLSEWFQALQKPTINPPNWVFGPVWTILYVMMGVAAGRVWALGMETKGVKQALTLFSLQLVLNFLWSILFFGFHQIGWALVDIILLWIAILITMRAFKPLDKMAWAFMWPYLAWVTFAGILNANFVYLN